MERTKLVWRLLTAAILALLPAPGAAHPGWGIVEDSQRNIYYTDLVQVWKIAPDGTRTVAVPNVHTHELYIDANDNVYGEHLWYEGEATDRWGYRVWRRSPDGTLTQVISPTEGFRSSYSFVRDSVGNMYWHKDGFVHRKSTTGADALLTDKRFRDIRSMTASAAGDVFVIDDGDLFRIRAGRVTRMAAGLGESTATMPFVGKHHQVMGLWLDPAGNVYAAVFGGQKVKRVKPDRRVDVLARSTIPWSPSGGLVARDGSLWLLEYSLTNQARIRNADRHDRGGAWLASALLGGVAATVVLAFLAIRAFGKHYQRN